MIEVFHHFIKTVIFVYILLLSILQRTLELCLFMLRSPPGASMLLAPCHVLICEPRLVQQHPRPGPMGAFGALAPRQSRINLPECMVSPDIETATTLPHPAVPVHMIASQSSCFQ